MNIRSVQWFLTLQGLLLPEKNIVVSLCNIRSEVTRSYFTVGRVRQVQVLCMLPKSGTSELLAGCQENAKSSSTGKRVIYPDPAKKVYKNKR